VRRYSIVIPTMRRPDVLRDTLESVLECDPPAHEVIVIDADEAASAKPLVSELGSQPGAPSFRYIRTAPSLTRQRNVGIDATDGDVVVFLDDDVIVPTILFARLEAAFDDEGVAGVTGRIIEEADTRIGNPRSRLRRLVMHGREGTFTSFGYPRYVRDHARARDVEYMLGCFMSARREAAAAVRFDEALGGYALAEDEDFSYRLSRLGRIRYLPDLVIHHHKFGFSGAKDTRDFGRLVVRNRAYLFRKNFPQTRRARAGFAGLIGMLVAHRLVNRQWQGARGLLEGAVEVWRRRA
jgi:GT2 family glycosyltransferase